MDRDTRFRADQAKRLPFTRLLALASLGFALTLLINTLEPAVLSHKVLALAPDQRNTAFGFTTFAGLIVAILAQPIIGALSDRTRTRWGRRIPYFAIGIAVVAVCLYLTAAAPDLILIFASFVIMQLGVTCIQGPWQALIPDQVPIAQRGQASGLKAMLDILALIVGRLLAGQIVSRVPEWGTSAVYAAVTIPVIVFALALIVTARSAHEDPDSVEYAPKRAAREVLSHTFAVDFRTHPTFARWFVNRLLFWSAFIGLSVFLLFYAIDVLGMAEAEAQSFIGQVSALLGVALLLILIPASWLTDRIGRRPLVIAACLVAALGTAVILATRDRTIIIMGAVIVGAGVGTYMTASWALITDIVPRHEAARYLGIANMASAGGSAISRLFGGALIDGMNAASGSTVVGYTTLQAIAVAFFLLSALVAVPLPSFAELHRPTTPSPE